MSAVFVCTGSAFFSQCVFLGGHRWLRLRFHSWNMLASYHNIYTFSFYPSGSTTHASYTVQEGITYVMCLSFYLNQQLAIFFNFIFDKQSPCSSGVVSWLWRNEITQPLGFPPPFLFHVEKETEGIFLNEHSWSGEFWLCVGCIYV